MGMDFYEEYFLAKMFARGLHYNQKYGNDEPYMVHLADVDRILVEFGYLSMRWVEIRIAAWLHDAVEDQDVALDDIEELFGKVVRDIVWCVTDGEGKNRRERHEHTYLKLNRNRKAVILKLADRIANVRQSLKPGSKGKLSMYKKEWAGFQDALRHNSTQEELPLWQELDRLFN